MSNFEENMNEANSEKIVKTKRLTRPKVAKEATTDDAMMYQEFLEFKKFKESKSTPDQTVNSVEDKQPLQEMYQQPLQEKVKFSVKLKKVAKYSLVFMGNHWKFFTFFYTFFFILIALYIIGVNQATKDAIQKSKLEQQSPKISQNQMNELQIQNFTKATAPLTGASNENSSGAVVAPVISGVIDVDKLKNIFSFKSSSTNDSKKQIYVFSDPECAACKVLDENLNAMVLDKKIGVNYIPTPLRGESSAILVTQVICANDPSQAWKSALAGVGIATPNQTIIEQNNIRECAKQAIKTATTFRDLNLAGTPTIVAPDGRYIIGVLNATELTNWLDGKDIFEVTK